MVNQKSTSWLCLLLAASVFVSIFEVALSFSPTKRSFSYPYRQQIIKNAVADGSSSAETSDDEDEDSLDMDAFKARKEKRKEEDSTQQVEEDFDGYAFRDVIYEKWGLCYDLDFNRVDSFGFRGLYLNVLPFHLGGRRFRHETELDYLCHLQAVVEILVKYDQLGYILAQIAETDKKPRAGTSPLVAVPLRLDLTRDEVTEIIGY